MVGTITRKTKGRAKKRPKDVQLVGTKEGRELIPLMVGIFFTHNLSNVAYMHIMRFNNNRRPRTSIFCQHNLPF
jgi:hypothetical protein